MTRRSAHLDCEMPESIMEIHPEDAVAMQSLEGDLVQVSSRRGTIRSRVMLTDRIGKGVVFMPFHFAEASANVLTNSALDSIAQIPEFKVCAVKLEKAA